MIDDAKAFYDAGCFSILCEVTTSEVAEYLAETMPIPVISLGAGNRADGVHIISSDLFHLWEEHVPKHSRIYTDLIPIMEDVITRYMKDVVTRDYPGPKETVNMDPEELKTFAKDMKWERKLEEIGKAGDKYMAFLFSLFFFVFFLNFMGIFPGAQFAPTALFVYPVALAMMVWLVYMFIGMRNQGPLKFFTNMMFPPGVPKAVLVILAPIEFLSNVLVRPFTLAVRLMANMFAGHLLITVFIVATIYLFSPSVIGMLGSVASGIMTLIMTGCEFMIEALQAYIFTLLTASYIAGSLSNEH